MQPHRASDPEIAQRFFEVFHENSKQRRHDLDFNRRIYMVNSNPEFHVLMARTFKHYPGASAVALPEVDRMSGADVVATMRDRRSVRRFGGTALALQDLANVLGCSTGLTGQLEDGAVVQPVRAAPSAGALFPIETYVAALNVAGLPAGLYHYRVDRHELEHIQDGDPGPTLAHATFDAKLFEGAGAALLFAGAFGRSYFKYGERGYRFAVMEAGHICQNALLAAAGSGLGATSVGGFIDDELNAYLDIDGVDEAMLYMAVLGHPARAPQEEAAEQADAFLRALAEAQKR